MTYPWYPRAYLTIDFHLKSSNVNYQTAGRLDYALSIELRIDFHNSYERGVILNEGALALPVLEHLCAPPFNGGALFVRGEEYLDPSYSGRISSAIQMPRFIRWDLEGYFYRNQDNKIIALPNTIYFLPRDLANLADRTRAHIEELRRLLGGRLKLLNVEI